MFVVMLCPWFCYGVINFNAVLVILDENNLPTFSLLLIFPLYIDSSEALISLYICCLLSAFLATLL